MPSLSRSEHILFLVLTCVCVIVSVVFVVAAIQTRDPSLGTRGGAITVALSFFALFMLGREGEHFQRLLGVNFPELERQANDLSAEENPLPNEVDKKIAAIKEMVENNAAKIEGVETRLSLDDAGLRGQSRYLAFNSVFGTLVWGFGDWLACLAI